MHKKLQTILLQLCEIFGIVFKGKNKSIDTESRLAAAKAQETALQSDCSEVSGILLG